MSSVRDARDTFLHVLADNLVGIKVHPLRKSAIKEEGIPQVNAVNVCFHDFDNSPNRESVVMVSIDIIYDDELTAGDIADQVARLLHTAAFTPKLNYSDPDNPVTTGTNISWDSKVAFISVETDRYSHYSATVNLYHVFS